MTVLYILFALFILGVIVFFHELGHYVAGRLCGIGVVEFAVGFGPKLIGWERKGIKYSVRAIPMGGFCKFLGEDEVNIADNAMNKQPVWKRFITVLSGPLMNFLLAFVVAVILMTSFEEMVLPQVHDVTQDLPAQAAGIEAGDIIKSVDGHAISYDENGAMVMRGLIREADPTRTLNFVIERDGRESTVPITPELVTYEEVDPATGETRTQAVYQIGIVFGSRPYTLFESIGGSAKYMVNVTRLMLESLKNLVFKGEGASEVSGPVGIVTFMSNQVKEGADVMLRIVFLISLNLGIMNLLPLPALDGGRLVFLAVEGVRRKPVPPDREGMVHAIGLIALMGLILIVTYQDIVKVIQSLTN